jgi:hypothetical protein
VSARRATTAAGLGLLVAVVTGPAGADSTVAAAPAVGTASSGVTLLELSLGGHTVRVGDLVLDSDTTGSGPTATVTVTPVDVDGTPYERQSGPSLDVPSLDSRAFAPSALSALASAKSPVVVAWSSTADGASSRASTTSLGSVSLLGIPVALDGDVSLSAVVDGAGAAGEKVLTIRNVALPSIADLLAALGLDLTKLPVATLTTLTERLGLVTSTVSTAKEALETALAPLKAELDAALAAASKAATALVAAQKELATAEGTLASAGTALTDATKALGLPALPALRRSANALLVPASSVLPPVAPSIVAVPVPAPVPVPSVTPVPLPSSLDLPAPLPTVSVAPLPTLLPSVLPLPSLPPALDDATALLNATYSTAYATYTSALAAVNAATVTVNDLTKLQSTLTGTINGLLSQVQARVDALVAAVTGVLDATPLVSLDSITVRTRSAVRSAAPGGQQSEVVGGEVSGLRVLGGDVLANTLGSSRVDLSDLTGTPLAKLTSALNAATGTLSSVLSTVPTLPTLSVPAPTVGLLTKSTAMSVSNGFGQATNLVRALSLTLPAVTIPAAVQLPGAGSLPAFTSLPGLVRAQAVGDLVSTPVTLSLATLSDTVAFKPAVAGQQTTAPTTPTTSAPGASTRGTSAPATTTPGTTTPGTTTPGTTTPDTSAPRTGTPGTTTPKTVPTASGTPQLPRTGLGLGLPALAALMLGGAYALRRRLA